MATIRQEMPPQGGYAPITYKRIPLKGTNIYLKAAAALATMTVGWWGYHYEKRIRTNERIEMRCARIALMPMLTAETDRMTLKQLKKNRDDEARIMKDVEGWEVGKWKGNPVFLTLDPNEYFEPAPGEFYIHADPKDFRFVLNLMQHT